MNINLHAHPICGESYIQCNTNQEVATLWTLQLNFTLWLSAQMLQS